MARGTRINVSTVIDARPGEVWAVVEDIASHVDWMADAEAIRFTTERTSGVGTTFECDTKVGPFRLTDVMQITPVGAACGHGRPPHRPRRR